MKEKTINIIKSRSGAELFVVICMIIELIYLVVNICTHTLTENILNELMTPVVFGLIMIGYSNYSRKMYIGIIQVTAAIVITAILNIINGYSFNEAIAAAGMELPVGIFGIAIMLIYQTYKQYKVNKANKIESKKVEKDNKADKSGKAVKKERVTLKSLFSIPKKTSIWAKIIILSIMYSIFLSTFIHFESVPEITNTVLKVLVILQGLLPVFIMLSYITFTDLTFWIMIMYNITYMLSGFLTMEYLGIDFSIVLHIIELTFVVGYNYLKLNENKMFKKIKQLEGKEGKEGKE